ncbi:hypothetical protein [Enhygromyxa salina]|uniref:hypothetical protein n=1 Tax=Enhygromyxa salina TaxID=215803 RepID=UPI000D025B4E|nr:hypothetical protein [Enhygromyxa salina]
MQRWLPILVSVAVIAFAGVGAQRWWWRPRVSAAASAAAPALVEARDRARAFASARGLALSFDAGVGAAAELTWRAPGECVEVYRVRVDETFRDPAVAVFLGREEEHASWALALAARPSSSRPGLVAVDGLLMSLDPALDPVDPDSGAERRRQLWWSARAAGPAAPDFACRQRSWDPLEDAVALGWPALPDHRVRVGEAWLGGAVEGRCHETTCVDDQGQFPHDRPCRARPWREVLAGVSQGPPEVALILGNWDDGHDLARPEIGILTSRELLIVEGRPLRAHVRIEQRWVGVVRELELTRIDDCGDQTTALNDYYSGDRSGDSTDDQPDNRSVVTRIRARLRLPPTGPAPSPQTKRAEVGG